MSYRPVYAAAVLSLLLTVAVVLGVEYFLGVRLSLLPVQHARPHSESVGSTIVSVVMFAGLSVGIMGLSTLRLIRKLNIQEKTLRKHETERLKFATDAAHELRTPLAILRARIDSLDDNDTTVELKRDVDHITRIVEQVLAKSRIEALGIKPGEMVDLCKVCHDVAAYLAPLTIREGRSIEVVGADKHIVINGNLFALEQALRNLVENAIKYSARGSTITIEIEEDIVERRVCVLDRGRGIPELDRELIFERFRRADRRGIGSGLGLSIVRGVAEAHGGHVSVEDAPGGGARFSLHFLR